MTTAEQLKSNMAVWSFNGKTYECGFGLYDFRLDHTTSSYTDAEKWCAEQNRKLARSCNTRRDGE